MDKRTGIVCIVAVLIGIWIGASGTVDSEVGSLEPISISEQDTITIGHIVPLTGDLAQYGIDGKEAITLAVADYNEYLAVLDADWRLDIIHEDSQSSSAVALEKLTSLKARGIDLIIGPYSSANLRALIGYAESNSMVLISSLSTAAELAIADDSVFRLVSDDNNQGPAIARLVRDLGIDTLVTVQRGDVWGDGLYESTAATFEQIGGTADEAIRYNPELAEVKVNVSLLADKVESHVDELGTSKVGVLVISFAETLEIIQEASNYDILDDVLWFCTEGIVTNQNILEDSIGHEFSISTDMRCTQTAVGENPTRTDVESRLYDILGRVVDTYAYGAYDAVWILGTAILDTQGDDSETIKDAIPSVARHRNGAIGSTLLNEAGDLDAANYAIWKIVDGKWVEIANYIGASDQIIPTS